MEAHRAERVQRGVAVFGMVVGVLGGLIWGIIAYFSYRNWRRGSSPRPGFAWWVAGTSVVLIVCVTVAMLAGAEIIDEGGHPFPGGSEWVWAALGAAALGGFGTVWSLTRLTPSPAPSDSDVPPPP